MDDYSIIRQFKCSSRAKTANKRFEDKINSFDVLFSLKLNNFNCFYCNDKIDYKDWELDHFHPKANGGKNKRENLVACCKWCNTMKNALDGNSFINKCNQIIKNNFFIKNNLQGVTSDKIANNTYKKIKKTLIKYDVNDLDLQKIKELINNL